MSRRTAKFEYEPAAKTYNGALELICCAAGVLGILFALADMELVRCDETLVFAAGIVLCASLWLARRVRRLFPWYCAAYVAGMCAFAYFSREKLTEQVVGALDNYYGNSEAGAPDAMTLALLAAAFVAFAVYILESVARSHWLPYFATTALLLLSPLTGAKVTLRSAVLIAAFQIIFFALRSVRGGNGYGRVLRGGAIIAAVSLAAGLIAAIFAVNSDENAFYGAVYNAEGFVNRSLAGVTELFGDRTANSGTVSRGNNFRTGEPRLELRLTREPTDTIYLREFAGGDYAGGSWTRSNDDVLYMNISSGSSTYTKFPVFGVFNNMYYIMNLERLTSFGEDVSRRRLYLKRLDGSEDFILPYYSRIADVGLAGDNTSYTFEYFERGEILPEADAQVYENSTYADLYRSIEELYMTEAVGTYLSVPVGILPRLTKLCRDNPQTSLEDVTAFIVYTLQSNASYTLTPGIAPLNRDIVEYFLFDSGRGYCVHFASAAALMYRLYGVPSRYAAGYAVSPDDFTRQPDGSYLAEVTDESAHAWAEIFISGSGWTPIETTPGDWMETSVYPGFDVSALDGIMERNDWNISVPSLASEEIETETSANGKASALGLPDIDKKIAAVWLVYLLLLVPIALGIRRAVLLARLERSEIGAVFTRMLTALDRAGILSGADGTEPDFARLLSDAVPAVSLGDAERLMDAVNRSAFGRTSAARSERELALDIYYAAAHRAERALRWYKRPGYILIGAYI